jgi:hypothetical protein
MLGISEATLIYGDVFQEYILVQVTSLFQRFVSVTIYIYIYIYIYIPTTALLLDTVRHNM